eukprot:gene17860-24249_t
MSGPMVTGSPAMKKITLVLTNGACLRLSCVADRPRPIFSTFDNVNHTSSTRSRMPKLSVSLTGCPTAQAVRQSYGLSNSPSCPTVSWAVQQPKLSNGLTGSQAAQRSKLSNGLTGCPTVSQAVQQSHRLSNSLTGCPTVSQAVQQSHRLSNGPSCPMVQEQDWPH